MAINLVAEITQKAAALSFELQREALDFIEFIAQRQQNGSVVNGRPMEAGEGAPGDKRPFKSVLGSLEHLGMHITDEDIAEVRREMWANFPREEPR